MPATLAFPAGEPTRKFGIDSRRSRIHLDEIKEMMDSLQQATYRDDEWDKKFKEACRLLDIYIKNIGEERRRSRA